MFLGMPRDIKVSQKCVKMSSEVASLLKPLKVFSI